MPTLEWIGKEKVINHHQEVPFRILEKKYTYNAESSENMIIHGDNLLALKSLLPQYEGKVDCIYIDPPYNTGNEKWVYNDNVNDPKIKRWLGEVVGQEGEDLSRHDKWLCMMYPRLKLLYKLLSKKGVIFISIDDNELYSLKYLCDEIFGQSNYLTTIVVENDSRARPYNSISITHEYVLLYRKSEEFESNVLIDPNKKFRYQDDEGGFDLYELRNRNSDFNIDNRPNLYYPFWVNPNKQYDNDLYEIDLQEHEGWVKFYPQESQGIKTVWRWGKEKAKQNLNTVIFGHKASGGWQVVKKYREATYSLNSVWTDSRFSSDQGTLLLKKFFDNKRVFGFPKPIDLINQCFSICLKKDALVLDSFAGSGTTAHAVLDLNKQDGGNRKFILVEMMDYAETITAERVKRVIDGYGESNKAVAGLGGDFSYYELGEPLFKDDKNLNEAVGEEEIRKYVYYMETKQPLEENTADNRYYLGKHNDTAYYFYYEKDKPTTLNREFLATVKTKASGYLIYADICALSAETLSQNGIVFKKIPRDIKKL